MKISVHKKDFLPHISSAVDFEIKKGEIVLLRGENGIGKSSLAKEIVKMHAGRTSFICQEDMDLFYDRSLKQIKKIYVGSAGSDLEIDLFQEFWSKFDLGKKEDRPQSALSGGESQMLKICLGVFLKKELIILDEPSQNLDSSMQQVLNELVRELAKLNRSVLIIEHETKWLSHQTETIHLAVKDQTLVGERR